MLEAVVVLAGTPRLEEVDVVDALEELERLGALAAEELVGLTVCELAAGVCPTK